MSIKSMNKIYKYWSDMCANIPEDTCSIEVNNEELEFYILRLRFMEDYKKILNSLLTVEMYSRFRSKVKGKRVSPRTVEYWMLKKKISTVSICGRVFVLVPDEEIAELNDYLIENELRNEPITMQQKEHHERIFMLYSKQEKIEPVNTLKEYFSSKNYEPKGNHQNRGYALIDDEYKGYFCWCVNEDLRPLQINEFSKRITDAGFKRTRNGKRGFVYYLHQDEKDLTI